MLGYGAIFVMSPAAGIRTRPSPLVPEPLRYGTLLVSSSAASFSKRARSPTCSG
ncbi:MAG: hypothetical protein ACLTMP_04210 [Eggerthella lenta]